MPYQAELKKIEEELKKNTTELGVNSEC